VLNDCYNHGFNVDHLFQLQESLDREKKVRADVEKVKRKVETDLKATQESVEELDRIKHGLEDAIRK